MQVAFLEGDLVILQPLERQDLANLQLWNNGQEMRGLIGQVYPESESSLDEWFERVQADKQRVWFAVVRKSDGKMVGEAGLLRMYHPWRTTDLTMIIGDPEARGQGLGTEAIVLLMDYAFGYLGFHRIAIGVVGFNERALSFYERVGFKQEGVQRNGYYYNHRFSDFVMMSILEDEFRALHKVPLSARS